MVTTVRLAQAEARSLELHPGFSCTWQRFKYVGHSALFPGTLAGANQKRSSWAQIGILEIGILDILIWDAGITSASLTGCAAVPALMANFSFSFFIF